MEQNIFNAMELDAIGEIMNISLGSSATAVSNMLDHRVDITTPSVSVVSVNDFSIGDLEPAIGIEIRYVSGLEGSNIMLLRKRDVKVIVDILMGSETPDEEFELNELTVSAVCEVMNQMMGAASTALSDFLGRPVNISTPQSFALDDLDKFKNEHFPTSNDTLVVVRFMLSIENVLKSEFVNVIPVHLARELLAGFELNFGSVSDEPSAPTHQPAAQAESAAQPAAQPTAQGGGGSTMSQDEIEQMLQNMSSSASAQAEAQPQPQPVVQQVPVQQVPVQQVPVQQVQAPMWQVQEPRRINATPVQLPSLEVEERLGKEQTENLEMIMSVPLEVSVEIGRVQRKVEDILAFSKGSLIVLDKLAGDQVDLYVNGLCVARGDVVVIDDNFGVRITEVLKQTELLKRT